MSHVFWKEDIEDRVKFLESIILNCAPLPPGKCTTGAYFWPYTLKKKFTENTECACGNICIYIYLYLFWFSNYYTLGLNFVFGHGNVCWNKGKINKI